MTDPRSEHRVTDNSPATNENEDAARLWNSRARSRPPPKHHVECHFPPAASAVTEARHWVRRTLARWGLSRRASETAAFNVTELAANAVVHARSPFRVSLSYNGEAVRVTVVDASPDLPREMHAAPSATAGRGLALVRAMSDRVGAEPTRPGKHVWAEIRA